nr:uncharacterized protein LOC111839439 isoform X2 [Paramormyrops kingsleyae]
MYTCPQCSQKVSLEIRKLIWHLREVHALSDSQNLNITCSQDGCPRTYHSFNSFSKHLSRAHTVIKPCSSKESAQSVGLHLSSHIEEFNLGDEVQTTETSQKSPKNLSLMDCAASFAARMYASANVTFTDVQRSITCTKEVLDKALDNLQEKTNALLSSLAVPLDNSEVQGLMKDFDNTRNMFNEIDTPFKLTKYFSENFLFEKPTEVFLGHRADTFRKSGEIRQVLVADTFQYISVINTIKFLFSCDKMQSIYMQSSVRPGKLQDYCDGTHYARHPLYQKYPDALQLQLYYDDFETTNPLGSKTKIHKMGAVYFAIRNLSPEFNSLLSNLHLCVLFNSVDRDTYGFERIMEPLIVDIKKLECSGVQVEMNKESHIIYGTVLYAC